MARSGNLLASKQLRNQKRTLTRENILGTVGNALRSSPTLVRALVKPRTSAALREKIMLGVSSVTDCSLCQWGHSNWATAHGVPLEEINEILGQQAETLKARNPAEAEAILFAQHYAETDGRFDPAALVELREFYSEAQVAEILAYVRTVTLGSLTGNALEALRDRFRPAEPKD